MAALTMFSGRLDFAVEGDRVEPAAQGYESDFVFEQV
jgi:hypothetical protein